MEDGTRQSRRERRRAQDRKAALILMVLMAAVLFGTGLFVGLRAGRTDPTLIPVDPVDEKQGERGQEPPLPQESHHSAAKEQEAVPASYVLPAKLHDMVWPLAGKTVQAPGWYFSEPLNEWRYFPGILIEGQKGSQVKSCLAGVVRSISTDGVHGTTVILDHGNEIVSCYKGLAKPVVSFNQHVKQGDLLAYLDGEQLVFEVTESGDHKDPSTYLDLVP